MGSKLDTSYRNLNFFLGNNVKKSCSIRPYPIPCSIAASELWLLLKY